LLVDPEAWGEQPPAYFFQGLYYALGDLALVDKRNSANVRQWVAAVEASDFSLDGQPFVAWLLSRHHRNRLYDWKVKAVGGSCEKANYAAAAISEMLQLGMRLGETREGRLGWFTEHAKSGHVIAVISGCSVPVILSPMEDGTYMMVGDSIIPGMMDGGGLVGNLRDEDAIWLC
jgi:hypothetical protein